MIEKTCTYPVVYGGEQNVHWIEPGQSLEKVAYPLPSEIETAIGELPSSKDHIYLLINALGASEHWGQNINGDRFYISDLAHEGHDYGYKTFMNGKVFAHHTNKDPSRGFGDILKTVWNPHMKRVELLVQVDKEKGHSTGNGDIIDKLEAGDFTDTSMGTKVPYDLCTLCYDREKYNRYKSSFDPSKHKSVPAAVIKQHLIDPVRGLSRTTKDYCSHLKTMKGKILPDGTQVGMVNCYPKFFDISFVFIGADRTSKVMAFFWPPRDSKPKHIIFPEKGDEVVAPLQKEASLAHTPFVKKALFGGGTITKTSELDKESDIVKKIVTNFRQKVLSDLEKKEVDLPQDKLESVLEELPDDLSPKSKLGRLFSALSSLGIILKKPEYQRIVLISIGKRPMAESLNNQGIVFKCNKTMGPSFGDVDSNFYRDWIANKFMDMVPSRSFLHPFITKRVVRFKTIIPPPDRFSESDDRFLDKIASSYNNYRYQVIGNGYGLMKKAEYAAPRNPNLPYGAIPYVYANRAYRDAKPEEAENEGSFLEKHPWFVATLLLGGGISAAKVLKNVKK